MIRFKVQVKVKVKVKVKIKSRSCPLGTDPVIKVVLSPVCLFS